MCILHVISSWLRPAPFLFSLSSLRAYNSALFQSGLSGACHTVGRSSQLGVGESISCSAPFVRFARSVFHCRRRLPLVAPLLCLRRFSVCFFSALQTPLLSDYRTHTLPPPTTVSRFTRPVESTAAPWARSLLLPLCRYRPLSSALFDLTSAA